MAGVLSPVHWKYPGGVTVKNRITAILTGVMYASLLFGFIIGSIMIIDFISLKKTDPLNNPNLLKLESILEDGGVTEEVVTYYRDLHLLSRKVFFAGFNRLEVGRYILGFSLILFFITFQVISLLNRKSGGGNTRDSRVVSADKSVSFYVIIFCIFLISGIGFVFSMFSGDTGNTVVQDRLEGINVEIYDNWPGFRGPLGSAYSAAQVPHYFNIDTGENVIWEQDLKVPGYNSPVIWDDKIYITGGSEELFVIYSFDFKSGQPRWEYEVFNGDDSDGELPEVTSDTGFAAATSAVDSEGIYSIFANGELLCVDHNGQLNWRKSLGTPENLYGHASSLIILNNLLYVQFDHEEAGYLYAIDTLTGETLWSINRDMGSSWSSPIIAESDAGIYLILNSNPFVVAYNPYTGDEIWRVDCLGGEVASSSLYSNGTLFAVSDLTSLYALNVDTGEILWENYELLPNTSSPAATEDYVYICTAFGVIGSYDINTGDFLWEFEDMSIKGCYSSPIVVGDKLFTISREGEVIVFDTKDSSEIGRSELNASVDTTPAFYKNSMIIRTDEKLYKIAYKEKHSG